MPAHPQDHVGHHHHRDGADDGLDTLLLLLLRKVWNFPDSSPMATQWSPQSATPTRPARHRAGPPAQERRHDPHDRAASMPSRSPITKVGRSS